MEVSVIIPVYNAEKYIEETVNSVIIQPEAKEIILVEDGSKDNSLAICQELQNKHSRIKLFTHENNKNKGTAESRNLGIHKATCSYVTFLDADDLYMEHRFKNAALVFSEHPEADGVFERVENFFDDEESKEKWLASGGIMSYMITAERKNALSYLEKNLLNGSEQFFLMQGLIVRKNIFSKAGFFQKEFEISEDTIMLKKLLAVASLFAVNSNNTYVKRRVYYSSKSNSQQNRDKLNKEVHILMSCFLEWALKNKEVSIPAKTIIIKHAIGYYCAPTSNRHLLIFFLTKMAVKFPLLLNYKAYWKSYPLLSKFL